MLLHEIINFALSDSEGHNSKISNTKNSLYLHTVHPSATLPVRHMNNESLQKPFADEKDK